MRFFTFVPFLSAAALAAPVIEERQTTCNVPASFPSTTNAKLPNPFKFFDGRSVTTKAEFACKNAEVSAALQAQELGVLPPKPSSVTASFSGSTLSITAAEGGKSISFSVTIQKPSGAGPFPAIIAYGAASIPIPAGVATIIFNNDDIAAQQGQNSRGQGKFYTLYGSSHSAGALTAWAWGVDRILDALTLTPSTAIDATRVGVTGCSRNGKGAFVAGALVPRIALTIPQESGAGGAACWRVSDAEKARGKNIQTASQIVTENVWFSTRFNPFSSRANTLAFDHHQLAGLVAPRGLLVVENEIDWLGPVSTGVCMRAGRLIYKALGVPDNMGFTGAGGHTHCSFPGGQQATDLTAFVGKFLLKQSTSTAGVERGPGAEVASYIDWAVPTLT